MDTSIFLAIIISLVSLILIAVGSYIILVLREVRKNMERVGKILDHADNVVATIDHRIVGPTSSAIGIMAAVKEGLAIWKTIQHNPKKDDQEAL